MKEFDKWYKLDWGNSLEESCAAERAWRAALEWIKYAGVITDYAEKLIEEELNEK